MTRGSLPVQATVRNFDPGSRSGSVLFDDGAELAFDAAAFDCGGLRTLRVGQRVRLMLAEAGSGARITAVTIVTLAFPPGAGEDTAEQTSDSADGAPANRP